MNYRCVVIGWHEFLSREPAIECCRRDVKKRIKRIHVRSRKRAPLAIDESAENEVELAYAAMPRLITQALPADLKLFLNGLIEAHTLTFDCLTL